MYIVCVCIYIYIYIWVYVYIYSRFDAFVANPAGAR